MVRRDPSFKSALLEKVKSDFGTKTEKELRGALESKARWTVGFEIADFPRSNGKFNIPFFSKLPLQDEARKIEFLDFAVRVGFVKLSKVTRKPKAKP